MKPLALVIENDVGTRRLLDVLLGRLGLEVDLVASGTDAVLLLEHVPYDLVFVDLLLPGKSGADVLEWIATRDAVMLERCVVVSSAPVAMLERVRQRWPAVRVIRKPFELGEIVDVAQAASAPAVRTLLSPAADFARRSVRAGAKAGVLLRPDGEELKHALSFGYLPGYIATFFPVVVTDTFPICTAYRTAQPVWVASLHAAAQTEYPALVPVFEHNESRALAAIPVMHDGTPIGVVGWTFREPRVFTESEQGQFLAIAAMLSDGLVAVPERV
jgi:CheY-like chemotaxis protein